MRIKVTSLAILRHGLQKKSERENKEQKALVFKKERVRKKVAMPSQKEAREGKLLKEVPLPPNIAHTCTT